MLQSFREHFFDVSLGSLLQSILLDFGLMFGSILGTFSHRFLEQRQTSVTFHFAL